MKLDDSVDVLDLGFELVAPGKYNWEIDEGIQLFHNENSGKTSLKIPVFVESVIEGAGTEGGKAVIFVPIETEWGEKQLAALLTMTGLIKKFMEKFGEGFDPLNDENSMNALKLKLPGHIIMGTHEIKADKKGNDQVNFKKLEPSIRGAAKKVESKVKAGKKVASTPAASAEAGTDW